MAFAQNIELTIDGPAGPLAGTLEGREGPVAALILPGSGPTDRNGNNPIGLSSDAYRMLAEALAENGIPTLGIDKRGIGASGGDGNAVSLAEYRDDVEAWVATLRAETGAQCVWLIGHSEGGLIASFSADLPDLCGLILLTSPGHDLGDVLVDQIAANPLFAAHIAAFEGVVTDLSAGLAPDLSVLPPQLAAIFQPATLGYLTELITTDPAALVRDVSLPILAITGDTDVQIPASAAAALAAANPTIEAVTLAGMTHMLKQVSPGDLAAGALTYTDPTLPLHADLVPTLLDFIARPR